MSARAGAPAAGPRNSLKRVATPHYLLGLTSYLKLNGGKACIIIIPHCCGFRAFVFSEEQHDDQLLHELLRSLKALSTSEIGCFALRSSCPTPFAQLVTLLYSDKRPGDVATRQLIVDLLMILFELYPSSSLPSVGSVPPRQEIWETSPRHTITLPHPHQTTYSLLRSLLLTRAPRAAEAPEVPLSPHEFIDALHRPRIFKAYLQELADVCRDYFWIFCHPNNTIWVLAETHEARVEKPRAPGGMTGGVEFEAMGYMVRSFYHTQLS